MPHLHHLTWEGELSKRRLLHHPSQEELRKRYSRCAQLGWLPVGRNLLCAEPFQRSDQMTMEKLVHRLVRHGLERRKRRRRNIRKGKPRKSEKHENRRNEKKSVDVRRKNVRERRSR